ncbi:MAG: Acyl-CoA dehydrogenase [Acidimicrobiia bacterium]|nr:Acyl-CoA dehydrogenase [Acidimicrobiia bacterium]
MNKPPSAELTIDEVRMAFRQWMVDNAQELEPFRQEPVGSKTEAFSHFNPLQRKLWDEGWIKLGWPEDCGGLGGSPVQRAAVMEELAAAGYVVPEVMGSVEIIAPMLVKYAPELAREHLALGISGQEMWCQGFSEPDAGSDLGSLRTKAVKDGDGWRITGQKMWSSHGHLAQRCSLMARTGEPGYRGLTMFWVDMDSPGITTVPTECESGRAETAEIFLDDVYVPDNRVVGEVGKGWYEVMYLMQFERGVYAWQRQAELLTQLQHLLAEGTDLPADRQYEQVGNAYLAIFSLRARARETFAEMASGKDLGPKISVDKIMLGMTEQTVTDAARALLWPRLELQDDDDEITFWRRRWSFSRITTIYGGTAEVQRDLVAERLLGLPRAAK